MKWTRFTAKYRKDDSKHLWAFGKDGQYWTLRDHTGYERTLEKTWADSVPMIHLILENHGMFSEIS
jgi:hypothetical protein